MFPAMLKRIYQINELVQIMNAYGHFVKQQQPRLHQQQQQHWANKLPFCHLVYGNTGCQDVLSNQSVYLKEAWKMITDICPKHRDDDLMKLTDLLNEDVRARCMVTVGFEPTNPPCMVTASGAASFLLFKATNVYKINWDKEQLWQLHATLRKAFTEQAGHQISKWRNLLNHYSAKATYTWVHTQDCIQNGEAIC